MKNLFLTKTRWLVTIIVLITLGVGNVWGDTSVTISASSDQSSWTAVGTISSGSTTTVSKSNVIVSSTNGYLATSDNHVREYSNSVITISCSAGNIKTIAFTCTASGTNNNGPGKLSKNSSSDPGTYSYSQKVGTWSFGSGTSNVNSVTLKATAQCRWTQVDVTYVASAAVDPTASFSDGTYTIGGSVLDLSTLWTSNSSGAVTYTVTNANGTGASISGSNFTATTAGTCTVQAAQAAVSGSFNAITKTATITVQNPTCATPTFSPAEGAYLGTQSVTISCATGGSSIYYTTNGSTPTTSSTLYSGAISVSSTTTIKAIATKSGYANSTVASATYTITPAYTVTWKNQGATITTTGAASGTKPTLPSDATMESESGCGKYTYFYGWAEDTWSGEVTSPGTSSTVKVYKKASEMPNVTGDGVVYHAVWGDSPGGWSIVSSIAVDDVVVFAYTNGSSYYKELSGVSNSMGEVSDYSSTPSGLYPLTVCAGTASGYFAFKNGSNYLKGTTSNSLETETSVTDASSWSVSITNGVAEIENKANSGRKLKGNTSQYRIVNYNNSNANNINIWKQSADANCVTSCCNQLAAPENPGETPNSTGAVLTWDAVSGATGYEVKIDDGEWTSTGNGTTTGYTITGKTCGGTSVSWQVRATGDGSTNCAEGAATTARNFTTTACACTNQYTYFWGTQITNDNPSSSAYASHHFECFNTWNSTEGKTGLITLPNSDTENYWFVGYNGYYYNSNLPGGGHSWCTAIYDMNYANSQSDGKVLGWNSTAYPRGATGYIRIYSDNTNSNKYAAFIPSGYILRWKNNRNSDAWTSYPFTDTGASNYWETDLVQLGADLSSDKVWVGLPTSGMSESFTWCGKSEEKNLIGVGKKTGASTWADNGIVAGDANQWGKWRIEITNNATNWNVHFVPYWKATYDVNGGGAISPTATNEGPVSCEGDATARQVTMPAAPSYAHHVFGGWKSSADNQIYNGGVTVSLSQNTTFTAQWTNSQYNITATLTNVTTETSFPVAYTYTGSAANVTYTFAAASGYRLPDAVTVTGCTYEWDKTTGELTLTGTITGAVSITISGVQTHTVTWKSNGADYVSPVTYDHGASLVLPTPNPTAPSGCSSKVFVGWTARNSEIDTETSTKPTLINPASPGTVTGDVTYRAVFADEVTSTTTVIRYLYTTSISTGKNYIIASSNSAGSVNTATYTGTGNAFTNTSMTVVSGTPNYIAAPANNNAVWSVAAGSASGKYYIQNVGNAGNYIRINGSAANISTDQTDVYFDSDHGVFGKSGSGSTSYSFYYSSGWAKGTFSTSNRNYIFVATEVEVETTTTDKYITLCSTCTTPSNVTAGNISSTGATISWDGVSIEEQTGGSGTGFVVKYGTNAIRDNNNNTVTATSSESSKALTGLTPATQYYAWVQSKCDNSWSETPASFHTAAKITYDKNGGTGTNTSEDVAYNSNVTIKTIATLGFEAPSGKTFNGWLASSAVTVSGSSTTSVADGATISNLTAAITLTAQWRDLAQYHVTFSADNGTVAGGASQTVYENGTLTFPNVTSTTCGTFVGWVEAAYDNESAPSGATYHAVGDELAADPSMDGKTYYAVYKVATGAAETLVDNLVPSDFKATSTSYVATDNLTKTSSAVYQAVTAAGSSAIQINSISDQRGIVTSTSGGTFKGITLTTDSSHSASRKVYVYGSSSYTAAYASPVAFKDNNTVQGTLLATLEGDTKTYSTTTDDYEYIAIFANGAAYLDQISITWYGAPMKYQTSPSCSPMVGLESNFSTFSYVYNAGPSAAQSFTVSGSNLTADLVVTAPTNYEVCKTENGTYSSSVSYTHTDGAVSSQTVYIRLAAGLNAGTYNYTAANGVQVTSTGATTKNAALNGTVTKAAGSIAFTDFNAVDHYEAELTGSSVDVTLKTTVTGDGAISYSRSPAAGSSAISSTTTTATFRATTVGTWTVTATLAASTNYTGTSTTCQVIVYKADRFYDNIHPDVQALMDITLPIEKRGSYTAPDLMDADKGSANCVEKHYKFMGWITKANAEAGLANDDAYKAILIPAGTDMTASGTTYYAVWAEEE